MGTVREGTDTAGAPVGDLVWGATWRAVGSGRLLGGVSGTQAVSMRPPVTLVVVMTSCVIAWFSTVCEGGTVVWVFIVPIGADVTGASLVSWMFFSAKFGDLLIHSWFRSVSALWLVALNREKVSWKSMLRSDRSSRSSISANVASACRLLFSSSSSSTLNSCCLRSRFCCFPISESFFLFLHFFLTFFQALSFKL